MLRLFSAPDSELEKIYQQYSPRLTKSLVGELLSEPRAYPQKYEKAIDLHGFTRDEALKKAEWLVRHSQKSHLLRIRIITGKGDSSPNGPVLLPAIRDFLSAEKERSNIARFTEGEGMFEVFL
ncbi:MAG: Smr/MutS family protein [Candidatus Peregrinibacteria bacterium]